MLVITAFLSKEITFIILKDHIFKTPAKFHLMAEKGPKNAEIIRSRCKNNSSAKYYIEPIHLLQGPYYRWFHTSFLAFLDTIQY